MSALGSPPPEAMRTFMLRSSTPASTEKVLLYLEGMQKAPPGPDDDDKTSVLSGHLRPPASHASAVSSRRKGSQVSQNDGERDDIRSDVQESSEVARTIPIQTTGIPEREPGPDDPPGPHFESYGSSFGNFGPLPQRDSFGGPNVYNGQNWQNTPARAAGVPLPPTSIASPTDSHPNPFQSFGMTPAGPAGVPLPPSVASPSRVSNKSPSNSGNPMNGASSKAPSRALSPTRTVTGNGVERPWSPRSAASPSRVTTQKTARTNYPPLPESVAEHDIPKSPTQRSPSPPVAPPSRLHTKSPSIAPSESASQARPRYARQQTRETQRPAKSMKSVTEVDETPSSQRDGRSQAPMSPRTQASEMPRSMKNGGYEDVRHAASALTATRSKRSNQDPEATPTPSRPASPVDLTAHEQQMVNDLLTRPARTRTSFAQSTVAPSALEPDIQNSHFHDMELCQLLHALDQPMGEPVKKAVRKAVRARVKKLGMKYDNESIKQYRKSYHDHDPTVHLAAALAAPTAGSRRTTQLGTVHEPPEWARDLIDGMINMRERLDSLAPKIEKSLRSSRGGGSYVTNGQAYANGHGHEQYGGSEMNGAYTQSPMTQTVNIHTQPTGTIPEDSMYQPGDTDLLRDSTHLHTLPGSMHHHDGSMPGDPYDDEEELHHMGATDRDTRAMTSEYMAGDRDSSGQQIMEEELYKLRVKPTGSQSVATHKTWEVARDDGEDYDDGDAQAAVTESGLPEIPDGNTGGYTDRRGSPPLPPIPHDGRVDVGSGSVQDGQGWHLDYGNEQRSPPPWQLVHQRLLSWAIVWPMTELENALNSTTRGMQIDEVALSIWSTQTYKRYVRAKMTDNPPGRVDRLFVPPNMADAISTAVYNGRHGDACGMLRDLWAPFGLEGMPRLLVVLAKHRNDENHWVVHRFCLPDGSLTTYDTYPERCLPDGRPLGWWFAIRIAWPDAIYPSPDHLMQKMVRLHRPMQLGIDNSVAAAGIWRNLLMGSRAERSLDLERLRDLINTEVKNLRQRKQMGKLSISNPRHQWEDMN